MEQCCHCARDTHDAPLTATVAKMYDSHHFDADYDPDADESEIVCVGSWTYGPERPRAIIRYQASGFTLDGMLAIIDKFTTSIKSDVKYQYGGIQFSVDEKNWVTFHVSPEEKCPPLEDAPEIEVNIDKWDSKPKLPAPYDPIWLSAQYYTPSHADWRAIPLPRSHADYDALAKKINENFNTPGWSTL